MADFSWLNRVPIGEWRGEQGHVSLLMRLDKFLERSGTDAEHYFSEFWEWGPVQPQVYKCARRSLSDGTPTIYIIRREWELADFQPQQDA